MNTVERQLAEQSKKHKEMMQSNPAYALLYRHAQEKANAEKHRIEILNSYGPSSYIPKNQDKPRQPTDEELLIENVLKNY